MKQKLNTYANLLRQWNSKIRLTGSSEPEAIQRHLEEAESLLSFLPNEGVVLDIGSGGGFPGIPLAIHRPDLAFVLVEPIAKKVAFLQTCRRTLKLDNVEVVRARDEELEPHYLGADAAVSQATFEPAEWFRRGLRLVREGGRVLGLLGPNPGTLPADVVLHSVEATDNRTRRIGVLER